MRIIGNTPEGDLIIQVSQAEWDSLQDGVRPKNGIIDHRGSKWYFDQEAWDALHSILGDIDARIFNAVMRRYSIWWKEYYGTCTLDELKAIADGKVRVKNIGSKYRNELKDALVKVIGDF